jgi:hypothetical protein
MGIISGLISLAKDGGTLPSQHLAGKDGDNPGFSIRVLPGTIDIRIS